MAADDLCYADLVEVGQRIQTRRLSSVEIELARLSSSSQACRSDPAFRVSYCRSPSRPGLGA